MPQPIASLSLDLDNKWSYLKTRGDQSWKEFPSYLADVVPRFLRILDDLDLRATVFVVGQDAALPYHSEVLRSIASAGHEIGNHSFHHEPWLHRYSDQQLEEELDAAEAAIEQATGVLPTSFRGPGYSLSPALLRSLSRRHYFFDASTLPTFIGPLARAYYFLSSGLSRDERTTRKRLFGNWSDGLRPVRPYWWNVTEGKDKTEVEMTEARLLEIPVTTMPLLRLPFHMSYLLYLYSYSRTLAWCYWRTAMVLCRLRGTAPSLLLHPLDFLGGDEEPAMSFFPAMNLPGVEKRTFVRQVLADFARRYQVVPMGTHAERLGEQTHLPTRQLPKESPFSELSVNTTHGATAQSLMSNAVTRDEKTVVGAVAHRAD